MSVLVCVTYGFTQTSHLAEGLAKLRPVLHNRTAVPLRIPASIPELDDVQDIHAIVETATADEYLIVLGATPDCEGQHVCSYGALIGTSKPLASLDFYRPEGRKGTSVVLRGAIRGYYYEPECGAYCSDSFLVWTEGKYNYVVGLKVGTQKTLIQAANSAIAAASN